MNIIGLLKDVIGGVVLGIFLTLFGLSHDHRLKEFLTRGVTEYFQKEYRGIFCAQECSINLFYPSITFYDVKVTSTTNAEWNWCAERFELSFSWLYLLFSGVINLKIELSDGKVQTKYDQGSCDIQNHLEPMIFGPTVLPLFLQRLSLNNIEAAITQAQSDNCLTATLNAIADCTPTQANIKAKLSQATVNSCLKKLPKFFFNSETKAQLDYKDKLVCTIHSQANLELPFIDQKKMEIKMIGDWQDDHGILKCSSTDDLLLCEPITFSLNEKGLNSCGSMSIDCLLGKLLLPIHYLPEGKINISWNSLMPTLEGIVQIESDLKIPYVSNAKVKATFEKKDNDLQASVTLMQDKEETLQLNAHFNGSLCKIHATNPGQINFPYIKELRVEPNKLQFDLALTQDKSAEGNYSLELSQEKKKPITIQGSLKSWPDFFSEGTVEIYHYIFKDNSLKVTQKENSPDQLCVRLCENGEYKCSLSIELIQKLLQTLFGIEVHGNGDIKMQLLQKDEELLLTLLFDQGTCKLPGTYNILKKLDAAIRYKDQVIYIDQIKASFNTGTISCAQGIARLSTPYLFAPLSLDGYLINIGKELFAILSGQLAVEYFEDKAQVTGSLLIDHAQLKGNLFSYFTQSKIQSSYPLSIPIAYDLTILSKRDVAITTPLFSTHAQIKSNVQGINYNPTLKGQITLHSGAIHFPYKPLYITSGSLTFAPEIDPYLSLTARSHIKQYEVTLQASGSISDHQLKFSSWPNLTTEQIIALLMIGTPDATVSMLLPAVVLEQVKNILLQTNKPVFSNTYIKQLLKALKYIRFIPQLVDQKARGGVRGIIEIDFGRRWRAFIMKNFSLTEDTRFEFEYSLTDQILLRAIRDERSDVTGEVEMKWKF